MLTPGGRAVAKLEMVIFSLVKIWSKEVAQLVYETAWWLGISVHAYTLTSSS